MLLNSLSVTQKEKARHFSSKKMENQKKKKRLIVRNLSFQVSEKELLSIFSKFGKITEVTIPVKEDGKKRGFAFVQFEDTPSMIKAMKSLNYSDIKGRQIAIDYAIDKTKYQLKKQNIEKEYSSKDNCLNSSLGSEKYDECETVEDSDTFEEFLENESDAEEDGKIKKLEHSTNVPFQKFLSIKKKEDLSEGKTVFLRNINFIASKDALEKAMKSYGTCDYCVICIDPYTNHSKGTSFVKFKDKKSADKLIADSATETGVIIDGRKLLCSLAVSKESLSQQNSLKKPKDKRNLNLLKIGLILSGECKTVSHSDMMKRSQLEILKKQKLKNVNYFVSDKRLMVHNLPKTLTDAGLRKLFKQSSGKGAVITEARVMRDFKKTNTQGIPQSKGFGFVSFHKHEDALKSLLFLNNNPNTFTKQKRPIVEFSIENKVALLSKQRRKEKIQMRNKKRTEENNYRLRQNAISSDTKIFPKKKRTEENNCRLHQKAII